MLRDGDHKVGDMADLWRDILARPHVSEALGDGFELEGRHTAWPIPARVDSISLTAGRVLFVGDAAAATDVMTGEGIGQALLTGRLAAEAIAGRAGRPPTSPPDYERACRPPPVRRPPHVEAARPRARPPARRPRRDPASSPAAARGDGATSPRWMFEDEPRAIVHHTHAAGTGAS